MSKLNFVPCVLREILFEPLPTYWLIRKDRVPERVREYITPKIQGRIYVGEYAHVYKVAYGRMIELRVESSICRANRHLLGSIPQIKIGVRKSGKYINEHLNLNVLVARCWCPNRDPKHRTEVDHLDNNRHNNVATNLQWVTPTENYRRYYFNYNMLKLASKLNTLRKVIY